MLNFERRWVTCGIICSLTMNLNAVRSSCYLPDKAAVVAAGGCLSFVAAKLMLWGEMISSADGNGKEVEAEAVEGGQGSRVFCSELRGASTDTKNKDGLVWKLGGDLCLGIRVIAKETRVGRCQQLQGEVPMVLEEYGLPKRALFLCRC